MHNKILEKLKKEGLLGCENLQGSLLEVINSDYRTVETYGVTHKDIARELEVAIENKKVPGENYLMWEPTRSTAKQCAWGCDIKGYGNFLIYDTNKTTEDDLMSALYKVMVKDKMLQLNGVALNGLLQRFENDTRDVSDRIAVVSDLHPHLIEKHYFFGGKNTPYRAEPELLIDALGLNE